MTFSHIRRMFAACCACAALASLCAAQPADPALSGVSAFDTAVLADGADTGAITAELLRVMNPPGTIVPVSGHSVRLTVISAPNPLAISFSPASVVTNASGLANFTCRSTTAQAATIGVIDITQGNQLMDRTAVVRFTSGGRIYVDATASGSGGGINWPNAMLDLQAAMGVAEGAGASGVSQIWVAAGSYKPGNVTTATFALRSNLALYGGFLGGETSLTQRDPIANETILTGEIATASITDNVAHVVRATGVASSAVLDGFVITRGYAGYAPPDHQGAGLRIQDGAPTIANCTIRGNRAAQGAGGAHIINASPVFTNCTFEDNAVIALGGTFNGGGVWIQGNSSPDFINCAFRDNTTSGLGGGMCIEGGSVDVVSCLFRDNSTGSLANSGGGAIALLSDATLRLINATVRANATGRSDRAGGLDVIGGASATVRNSIFWENTAAGATSQLAQINVLQSFLDISHTTAQNGAFAANCNNAVDPLFEDDDGRLSALSPMLDSATDNPGAPGLPTADLDGNVRLLNLAARPLPGFCTSTIDRGAFEYPVRRCVKAANSSAASGTSWRTAFATLQDALDYVETSDGLVSQLWVAQGTYVPTLRSNQSDARSASFRLRSGLNILGGYFGTPATDTLRNPAANVTILSGEIGGSSTADNCYHVVRGDSASSTAILDGFRITAGMATGSGEAALGGGVLLSGGSPILTNLTVTGNGGLSGGAAGVLGGAPTFNNCVISGNGGNAGQVAGALSALGAAITLADVLFDGNIANPADPSIAANGELIDCQVEMDGDGIQLVSQTLDIGPRTPDSPDGSFLFGAAIELGATGVLRFRSRAPELAPARLEADVIGAGTVALAEESQVTLDNATIDLSDSPIGSVCMTPVGHVNLRGRLNIESGALQNCNVRVDNEIYAATCGKATGGEIFVRDAAGIVRCNSITSFADRYLRLAAGVSPPTTNITPNTVSVNVLFDGNPRAYGELYEYRGRNYTPLQTGFVQQAASPGYAPTETWVLDELILDERARMNLVDREADNPGRDALYVRNLTLSPNAVLNIGLGTLYYQTLTLLDGGGAVIPPLNPPLPPDGRFVNGARVFDIPLMGYKLGVITMESDCEFSVRISRDQAGGSSRVYRRDATDQSVVAANLGTGGVMEMRTQTATAVAARGSFARAYESEVTVLFRYLFRADPSAQPWPADLGTRARIDVFLSSNPNVGGVPTKPVGTIYQPPPGRPGAIGSGRWGIFFARVPRGSLDLDGGTFVELRLNRPGSNIWIDDFDPLVDCSSGVCFDLDGWSNIDGTDYLIQLAAYGEPLDPFASTVRLCLDRLSGDSYVDFADLNAGDMHLQYGDGGSCSLTLEGAAGGAGGTWPAGTRLLLAARPAGPAAFTSDQLIPLTETGTAAGVAFAPPAAVAPTGANRGNGRLVRDGAGELYQLHATQGVLRVRDGASIVAPQSAALYYAALDVDVYVGVVPVPGATPVGTPITDAAFDSRVAGEIDPARYVYVSPVTVETADGFRYTPAARLERLPGGGLAVDRIYGADPRIASTTIVVNDSESGVPLYTVYEPDYSRAREVETDPFGNVYLLSAQGVGDNDWLLVYNNGGTSPNLDDASPAPDITYSLQNTPAAPDVAAPSALLRAADGSLYLTSSANGLPDRQATIHRYAVTRAGTVVTGVSYSTTTSFTFPDVGTTAYPLQISTFTALAQDNEGTIYALGFAAPLYPEDVSFAPTDDNIATAVWTTLDEAPVVSSLSAGGVAMPISVISAACVGDLTSDGAIGLSDLSLLLSSFGICRGQAGFVAAADLTGDDCVGLSDLSLFLSRFGAACP